MRVQLAKALVMLGSTILIATCSTITTEAPAPSPTTGALMTSERPAQPTDAPTVAAPTRTELPTPAQTPTAASPPTGTATPTSTPTKTPTPELPTATLTQSPTPELPAFVG